jgi:hypothetical protein
MNKNFLFSICLLVGAFSMKGQYKNAVSFDPASFDFNLGLEYERFVFSRNSHHISLRAFAGFPSLGELSFTPGVEVLYGYGNNHRIEIGSGFSPNLKRTTTIQGDNFYSALINFRLGYAYFAKNNPMFYRVGFMPNNFVGYSPDLRSQFSWRFGFSMGIGYRF